MSKPRVYGHTKLGREITDNEIEKLASEAESGYDVDAVIARRGRRGRPPLGSAAATADSVRLGPELRGRVREQAATEGITVSELIRKALDHYLEAA